MAEHVGKDLAFGIPARQADFGDHARQRGGVGVDPREALPVEMLGHGDGDEGGLLRELAQGVAAVGLGDRRDAAEAVERGLHVAGLLADHHHAQVLAVDGERAAGAVEDLAARRRQQADVDAVLLRHHPVELALLDLQLAQAQGERAGGERLQPQQGEDAARDGRPVRPGALARRRRAGLAAGEEPYHAPPPAIARASGAGASAGAAQTRVRAARGKVSTVAA